jgi:hypothetical protein
MSKHRYAEGKGAFEKRNSCMFGMPQYAPAVPQTQALRPTAGDLIAD